MPRRAGVGAGRFRCAPPRSSPEAAPSGGGRRGALWGWGSCCCSAIPVAHLESRRVGASAGGGGAEGGPGGGGTDGGGFSPPPPTPPRPPQAEAVLALAGPAFLALAADPIAGLVDTAFLGRLGVDALASSGVALAALALASKVLCTPLTAVSTSALATAAGQEAGLVAGDDCGGDGEAERAPGSPVRTAARASVQAGAVGGLVLGAALLLGSPLFVRAVAGVGPDETPFGGLALDYLRVRALGAPALVVSVGALGSCRGLGDVRTPLVATVASNALNVVLDALFIFVLGLGVPGAAAATVAGEWLGLAVLLRGLQDKHGLPLRALLLPDWASAPSGSGLTPRKAGDSDGESGVLAVLLGRGGLLALRSIGVTGVFTVGSSLAARCGVHEAAAHQVCAQVWLSTSLLADALAVAAQALMGKSLAAGDMRSARGVADQVGLYGLGLGGALSLGLFVGGKLIPGAFIQDPETLEVAMSILPWVIFTQPLNALAFAGDGVLYGAEDFQFATLTMAVAAGSALAVMSLSNFTLDPGMKLEFIWGGLCTLMAVRAGMIGLRYLRRRGPFAGLDESKKKK